jgi:hypothetical protein
MDDTEIEFEGFGFILLTRHRFDHELTNENHTPFKLLINISLC